MALIFGVLRTCAAACGILCRMSWHFVDLAVKSGAVIQHFFVQGHH